ncbi:MAG: hypothetical protein ACK4FR_08715, partial [Tabrizicola sp.]
EQGRSRRWRAKRHQLQPELGVAYLFITHNFGVVEYLAHDIAVMQAGRDAGARFANSIPLRLPLEVASLFRDWLETTFPDRAARVMGRVRELHGGRDYDPEFGTRMRGQGLWADLIHRRADLARRRLGLGEGLPRLRCDLFRPPPRTGEQMTLF